MANAVGLVGLEVCAVRELDVTSLGADPKIGRSGIQLDEDLCTARVNTVDEDCSPADAP